MAETKLTLNTSVKGADKASKDIKKVGTATTGLKGSAANATSTLLKFAAGFASVTAAYRAFKAVAAKTIEFERMANQVKAFLPPAERTVENLNAIREEAIRVGKQLPLMNADILAGAVALEKSGFSAKEVTDALEGVAKMAVISGSTVEMSAEQAADTMRSFNLTSEEVVDVMNKITVAATSSSQNFEDLRESMKYANVGMVEAGQSIDEVAVLLASMANKGLKGSIAGTSLNQMMIQMSKKAKGAEGNLEGLNTKLFDSEGNYRDLTDVIKDLQVEMEGMNEQQRMSVLQNIAGVRGARALGVLLRTNASDLDNLKDKVSGATNSLNEMTDIMREGTSGAWQDTVALFDSLVLTLGQFFPFEELFRGIGFAIAAVDNFLKGLMESTQNLSQSNKTVEDMSVMWRTFSDFLNMELRPTIAAFMEGFTLMIEHTRLAWEFGLNLMQIAFKVFWEQIKAIFKIWWAVFSGIVEVSLNIWRGDWKAAWERAKQIFIDIFEAIKDYFGNVVDYISNKIREMANRVVEALNKLKTGLSIGSLEEFQAMYPAPQIQRRAMGGPLAAGQPSIVGERGPELFVPNISGSVVPNNKLGGTTQITFNGVFGRDAAEEIGDMLVERFRTNFAF